MLCCVNLLLYVANASLKLLFTLKALQHTLSPLTHCDRVTGLSEWLNAMWSDWGTAYQSCVMKSCLGLICTIWKWNLSGRRFDKCRSECERGLCFSSCQFNLMLTRDSSVSLISNSGWIIYFHYCLLCFAQCIIYSRFCLAVWKGGITFWILGCLKVSDHFLYFQ